jgi:hypothetical protein
MCVLKDDVWEHEIVVCMSLRRIGLVNSIRRKREAKSEDIKILCTVEVQCVLGICVSGSMRCVD